MSKIKKLFTNWRIIILLVFLLFSFLAISPNFDNQGATVRFVAKDSAAANAGIASPEANSRPMAKETVLAINNQQITNAQDYYDFVMDLPFNYSFTVQTDRGFYTVTTQGIYEEIITNETEFVTEPFYNETSNETHNITKEVPVIEYELIGVEDVGLTVYDAPTSNIRKGLDLSGGTRVILEPEQQVSPEDMELVLSNIKERLNVFGLSDIVVRNSKDLQGNSFIVVEIAGANKEEVRELLSGQGKFEAKIGEQTVFVGGNDITYVCRRAECAGIQQCGAGSEGASCNFRFSISLSPEAAQRHAEVTRNLDEVIEGTQSYLSEPLDLYLDDELVDSLNIASTLKGSATTEISISGGGAGANQEEAAADALNGMRRLQTILITGSLPVKLNIVKTDTISPLLGAQFLKNALFIGLAAILSVAVIVFLVYRKFIIAIPMVITILSETTIILGLASLIGWNLDLAAIAGIIIAIGTGVDHQIVIADEVLGGNKKSYLSWKDRIKNAFFIIMAAYFTTMVAMIPLWFAGAGLLKGFAVTTILGVSAGVFITRPAYAAMLEIIGKE